MKANLLISVLLIICLQTCCSLSNKSNLEDVDQRTEPTQPLQVVVTSEMSSRDNMLEKSKELVACENFSQLRKGSSGHKGVNGRSVGNGASQSLRQPHSQKSNSPSESELLPANLLHLSLFSFLLVLCL